MTKTSELISLADLARELKCNKSRLTLYASCGVICREGTFGKTNVFNRKEALRRIKETESLKKQGYSLKEIGAKFKEKDLPQGD